MANILVVGPHPDDQELGMGGTIVRLAGQGHDVLLLDMCNGEPTPHGSPEQREKEWTAAAEILGVQRRLLPLRNRQIEHTLEARHLVAAAIREHQASIVFTPYPIDAHPDHVATTRIVEDARFDAKLTQTDIPGEPIYPKDDTPGCTKQACNLRDHLADLKRAGVAVVGVSPDDGEAHGKFTTKYDLPFPLLADPDKTILQAYGTWGEKNLYGKKSMGVKRTSFLIDPEGVVRHVFKRPRTEAHAEEVLAKLGTLG
jgi:peroxiredoxin Q/BCP